MLLADKLHLRIFHREFTVKCITRRNSRECFEVEYIRQNLFSRQDAKKLFREKRLVRATPSRKG